MNGSAYRFAQDIGSRRTILNILTTYIIPINEYCSFIWRRYTGTQNYQLEKPLRFASRIALHLPYRHTDPLYKNYKQRIDELGILTTEERSIIAAIIFICKCAKGDLQSPISQQIRERRIETPARTRNPNIFQTAGLQIGSTLRRLLITTNNYRHAIDLESSILTIRGQLRQFILSTRDADRR